MVEADIKTGQLDRAGTSVLGRLDRNLMATAGGGLSPDDRGFRLAAALTRIGDTDFVVVHVLIGTLLVPMSTKAHYLAAVSGAVLTASLLAQLLKRIVRRARPSVTHDDFHTFVQAPDPYSFPSGHTSAAFALAVATMTVAPGLGAAELLLATAIAGSRVILGAHYPMDVIAGIALGTGVALTWTQRLAAMAG